MEHKKALSLPLSLVGAADRRPYTLYNCRIPWRDVVDNRVYTNSYELLIRGKEAAVLPLLAASASIIGVEVTDDVSDYDKFIALCAAAPLWAGHPLYAAMHGVMAKVTGCTLPMTAANAPLIWKHYAAQTSASPLGVKEALSKLGVGEIHLCVTPLEWRDMAAYPARLSCKDHPVVSPVLCLGGRTHSTSPALASAVTELCMTENSDLPAYVDALSSLLAAYAATDGSRVEFRLPADWRFVKPDQYHAGESLKKMMAGKHLTAEEGYLWDAQTLRVAGQCCVMAGMTLAVTGGNATEMARLVAYLASCKCCPTMVYRPTEAGDVAGVLGRSGVSLGLALAATDAPTAIREKLVAYAAHAPLGALAGIDLPIHNPADVWTLIEARHALCDLLVSWREAGYAPRDEGALCALLARV